MQVSADQTTLTLSDHGRVFDNAPTNAWWYYSPSLAVNCAGDMVAGFSGSSATNYVGAFYSSRLAELERRAMKILIRVILLSLAVLGAMGISFAQGSFSFNNAGVGGSPIAPIYGAEVGNPHQQQWGNAADASPPGTQIYSGPQLAGTNYSVGGWYSLTPVADVFALNAGAAAAPGSLTVFLTDPFFTYPNGRGLFISVAANMPFITTANDRGAYLQVRVWDNAGGQLASWEEAWNAALAGSGRAVGWSKVFWQPVSIGPSPPPGLFNFEGFNIFIVPEPSTFVLLGLSGLSLLLFRRRK